MSPAASHRRITAVPSDFTFKTINAVHRAVLRASGGRLGGVSNGRPVLEVITTGRRSGLPRSVLLPAPLRDGEAYVVVGSRGGDDRHPAWFLNVSDNPHVQVSVSGGPSVPMIASVATAEERARLWPQVTARYRNYASYQKRTAREIPL